LGTLFPSSEQIPLFPLLPYFLLEGAVDVISPFYLETDALTPELSSFLKLGIFEKSLNFPPYDPLAVVVETLFVLEASPSGWGVGPHRAPSAI